jgi:membrane protein implicated in regulation of membrane protease activity
MPLLLGFVSMFGVGGLFSTQVLGLDPGRASLVGAVTGAGGSAVVYLMFGMLRRAEAPEAFSLNDLVGQTARVSVGIPAGRYGTVLLSFAGESHNLTATAEVDVPAGATVTVEAVAGSNLVVSPLLAKGKKGGRPT